MDELPLMLTLADRMLWTTALVAAPVAPAALAQSVADFYRGKTLRIVIGYAPEDGHVQFIVQPPSPGNESRIMLGWEAADVVAQNVADLVERDD